MNDFALYIFKQELKRSKNLQYTFVLEEAEQPAVIGNRTVDSQGWKAVANSYAQISAAVETYSANTEAAAVGYKTTIENIVERLSWIIRQNFWPKREAEGEAFANRFA